MVLELVQYVCVCDVLVLFSQSNNSLFIVSVLSDAQVFPGVVGASVNQAIMPQSLNQPVQVSEAIFIICSDITVRQ